MSKIEVVCPFCRKSDVVEKYSFSGALKHGLPEIKCPHCSKSWGQNLIEGGSLTKSAPSSGMAKLRDSLAELGRVVDAYVARREAPQPARFQPQGEETATVLKFVAGMPGGVMFESDVAESAEASRQESVFVTKTASGEAVAQAELQKALANGKPVTSSNYTRLDDGLEKGAPSKFRTVETVAPGVQLHHDTLRAPNAERASTAAAEHRSFQPGGETDMTKAHDAVNHALANGKRV